MCAAGLIPRFSGKNCTWGSNPPGGVFEAFLPGARPDRGDFGDSPEYLHWPGAILGITSTLMSAPDHNYGKLEEYEAALMKPWETMEEDMAAAGLIIREEQKLHPEGLKVASGRGFCTTLLGNEKFEMAPAIWERRILAHFTGKYGEAAGSLIADKVIFRISKTVLQDALARKNHPPA